MKNWLVFVKALVVANAVFAALAIIVGYREAIPYMLFPSLILAVVAGALELVM